MIPFVYKQRCLMHCINQPFGHIMEGDDRKESEGKWECTQTEWQSPPTTSPFHSCPAHLAFFANCDAYHSTWYSQVRAVALLFIFQLWHHV